MSSLHALLFRAVSRSVLRDGPSQSPWVCHSCRVRSNRPISDERRWTGQIDSHVFLRPATTTKSLSEEPIQTIAPSAPDLTTDGSVSPRMRPLHPPPKLFDKNKPRSRDPYGLIAALRAQDLKQVSSAVALASKCDPEYVRQIPKATWTEIWRAINPRNIIPSNTVRRSINLKKKDETLSINANVWLDTVMELFAIRRANRIKLDISDYRTVLLQAASIGYFRAAHLIWTEMQHATIKPDKDCYRAYMQAMQWDSRFRFENYRAPLSKSRRLRRFYRDSATRVFWLLKAMKRAQIIADTSTYCVAIRVLANDGDLKRAAALIFDQWGVDPLALVEGRPCVDKERPAQPPNSPTYPDQELLTTIADAYGRNKETYTAMNLFVFFSGVYGLEIGRKAWYQLSKWMLVHAREKATEQEDPDGEKPSWTSIEPVVDHINQHVKGSLTMDQFEVFFKSSFKDVLLDATGQRTSLARRLKVLEAGRRSYREWVKSKKISRNFELIKPYSQRRNFPVAATRSIAPLLRQVKSATLIARKKRSHLKRWCKYLINGRNVFALRQNPHDSEARAWRLRGMPRFLKRYSDFVPANIKYTTESGIVRLAFKPYGYRRMTESMRNPSIS